MIEHAFPWVVDMLPSGPRPSWSHAKFRSGLHVSLQLTTLHTSLLVGHSQWNSLWSIHSLLCTFNRFYFYQCIIRYKIFVYLYLGRLQTMNIAESLSHLIIAMKFRSNFTVIRFVHIHVGSRQYLFFFWKYLVFVLAILLVYSATMRKYLWRASLHMHNKR